MKILAILVFGIFVSQTESYYFVIAPNVIRFEHDEVVAVSMLGTEQGAYIEVWLELSDVRFSERYLLITPREDPVKSIIKVTESDISGEMIYEKPRYVKLCSSRAGDDAICRNVILSYESGYLLVHTDQPVYTPFQRVDVRVTALDESMKPISSNRRNISVDLVSPSNDTLMRRHLHTIEGGRIFYYMNFSLPKYPEIGMWTVRAFYAGQFETETTTTFEVAEHRVPTFTVDIDVSVPAILLNTDNLRTTNITVTARYVYDKPVRGNARLTLEVIDVSGRKLHLLDLPSRALAEGKGEFGISTTDILMTAHADALEESSLDGARLKIIAIVSESATANEESTTHDETVFASKPYIFEFKRSKKYFRPGMMYILKIDVLFANGHPVIGEEFDVVCVNDNGDELQRQSAMTSGQGQAIEIFHSSIDESLLRFKVVSKEYGQESDIFEVRAFEGNNQIDVMVITLDDNKLHIRALTNLPYHKKSGYTDILFVIVVRGHIVQTILKPAANQLSELITEDLERLISPEARLLAFYVDSNTGKFVADAEKFEVNTQHCASELSFPTSRPGETLRLKITGAPSMWIGWSFIDKEYHRYKKGHDFGHKQLFDVLTSHDIGCDEGSIVNTGDIFKNAGLIVLTNAKVDSEIDRISEECHKSTRRKRSTKYDGNDQRRKRSLEFVSEYKEDTEKLAEYGMRGFVRSYYRGLRFHDIVLSVDGEGTTHLRIPNSLTQRTCIGIGLTDAGLCMTAPKTLTTFKSFFVQLDIPSKVRLLERIDIKATVFYYGQEIDETLKVNVYFEGVESICYMSSEKGEPTKPEKIEIAPNSAVSVKFHVIPMKTGMFPVKVSAFADGFIPQTDVVEEKLFVMSEGVEEVLNIDVCINPSEHISQCLDDARVTSNYIFEEHLTSVDITLPTNAIPGTGYASATLEGIWYPEIDVKLRNIDRLLSYDPNDNPVLQTALNLYSMSYMEATRTVTTFAEDTGYLNIRKGLNDVIQSRNEDGSYTCRDGFKPTRFSKPALCTLWQTAFVAKMYCQARKVIDDADKVKADLLPTFKYLEDNTLYVSDIPGTLFLLSCMLECGILYKESQKIIETDLLADLKWLQLDHLEANPYELALATYVLSMTKSDRRFSFKERLLNISRQDNNYIYWSKSEIDDTNKADVDAIKTSSYALLAMLEFGDVTSSVSIMRWLENHLDVNNIINEPESIVGLEALALYSSMPSIVDLNVTVLDKIHHLQNERYGLQHVVENIPVEGEHTKVFIKSTGSSGSGRLRIQLRYNRPAREDESCQFEISDITVDDLNVIPFDTKLAYRNCDLCGRCAGVENAVTINELYAGKDIGGSSQIEKCISFNVSAREALQGAEWKIMFNLPTDMTIVEEDLKMLVESNENLYSYELTSGSHGFVVFNLKAINAQVINQFVFRVLDHYSQDSVSRKPVSVEVYDTSKPDQACRVRYGVGLNAEFDLEYNCNPKNGECMCFQQSCVENVNEDIIMMAKTRRRPALILFRQACSLHRVVIHVKVKNASVDELHAMQVTETVVRKPMLIGQFNYTTGDIIYFLNALFCEHQVFVIGKEYFVIFDDRQNMKIMDMEWDIMAYHLNERSIVIERPRGRLTGYDRLIRKTLDNFNAFIASRGCRL